MKRTSIGSFARRHRLALALCGIMAASAVIIPACGGGGGTEEPQPFAPDLSITKVGVVSGNTVTYTITTTNNGPVPAPGPIVMQDSLPSAPAGVLFSVATGSSGTCSGVGAGPVVCTSGTGLAAGGQLTYTITLTVPAGGGTVTNCASVTQGSTAGTSGESNLANNRGCATNTIVALVAPDLSITKVGVVSGNTVTYTITATNNGTVPAPGPIVMLDTLPSAPAGVLFSGATGSSGTCSGVGAGPIVCSSSAALAAGGQLSYTITLTVPASGGTVTNCASVTRGVDAATPLETNLTNNRACTTSVVPPTTPPAPDLSITKVGVVSGNTVTYTITVTNNGTLPTPGSIVMRDTLPSVPAGVLFSASGSTCSGFGAVPCLWSYSTPLAPGAQLVYTVTLIVPASGGTVINCASVAQGLNVGTPGEADLTNNRACATNVVSPAPAPDLSITKVGVVSGNTVTYTITATNNGTVPAPGPIVMQDSLPSAPAGVLFSGATGSSSTCSGVGTGPIVCTSGTALAAGGQLTYTITLTVPGGGAGGPGGGTVTNCASVTQGGNVGTPGETNLANNRACATNTVASSTGTLTVNATLAGGAGSAPWTGTVSYTLTGPQTITGTSASQTFASVPVGAYTLTYTSGGPPGATLNSVTPSVTQTLTAGSTLTFTLNFR